MMISESTEPVQDLPIASKNPQKVLVTTIGKVGSSSIYQFFIQCGFHPHSEKPRDVLNFIEDQSNSVMHTHDMNLSGYIAEALKKEKASQQVVIFTGSRDMMKRHISAMFENISNPRNRYWYRPEFENISFADQAKHFERCLEQHSKAHANRWLHRFALNHQLTAMQIKECADRIHRTHYCIATPERLPNTRIAFYRMENLNECWPRIVSDIELGSQGQPKPLQAHNSASDKAYDRIYRDFLLNYKPSPKALRLAYGCDLSSFYSEDEIKQQQQHWL